MSKHDKIDLSENSYIDTAYQYAVISGLFSEKSIRSKSLSN